MGFTIPLLAFACGSHQTILDADSGTVANVPWSETGSGDADAEDTGGESSVDDDRDGWSAEDDCDDSDAAIHPGATEVCNGVDDNCNADTDEGLAMVTVYVDADADRYGELSGYEACDVPPGSTPCRAIAMTGRRACILVPPKHATTASIPIVTEIPDSDARLPSSDFLSDADWRVAGEAGGDAARQFRDCERRPRRGRGERSRRGRARSERGCSVRTSPKAVRSTVSSILRTPPRRRSTRR